MSGKILIVDDEKNIRVSIANFLRLEGIETSEADNGLSAQRLLETESFAAVLIDLRMPGMDGMELLRWIRDSGTGLPVLMISAHGEIHDAVEAMKLGAKDYVAKPFDPEELAIRLRRIIEDHQIRAQVEAGRREQRSDVDFIGVSTQVRELLAIIAKVATTPSTILITGESGVGKEVVARAIHRRSRNSDGPFVAVNIGGVPSSLLESELFGYEKGAFTGASSQKPGMFELATHGTLFLDEIGEMPGELQVKLLRVIQDRKIMRLGSTRPIPIDTRIVAATNRDLERAVKEGQFREDLFYRFNVVRIRIPPLRERPDDIPVLIGHFITLLNKKMGTQVTGVTPDAIDALKEQRWPGNVRELENCVERALIFAETDLLTSQDLGITAGTQHRDVRPKTLKDLERDAIEHALLRWEGNRTKAADQLGITRRTLFNKINEYGLGEE